MMVRAIGYAGTFVLVLASAAHAAADVTGDNARLTVPGTGCVLVNNVWDRKVTPAGYAQSVFLEPLPGWRWNSPGKSAIVLAMPEIVCGDKPWDAPQALRPEFPIRAGEHAPYVRFAIDLKATGTYNMAFSLWAVSKLPAVQKTISLEIMIWNVAHGQAPAGDKIGAVEAAGTIFDLYLKKNQGMVTGPDPFTWPLVQFVARKPLLKGEIDFRPFLDDLLKRQILVRGHYLTGVELGNEVTEGTGEVRLNRFEVGVR
jgi:hypothetical protein